MSTHPLPTPDDVLSAREWLRAGCPALTRFGAPNAANSIATLRRLVDALPSHLPIYNYGSAEWQEAMGLDQDPFEMRTIRVRFKTHGSHVLARVLVNRASSGEIWSWAGELWFQVGAEWDSFRSVLEAEYIDETSATAGEGANGVRV